MQFNCNYNQRGQYWASLQTVRSLGRLSERRGEGEAREEEKEEQWEHKKCKWKEQETGTEQTCNEVLVGRAFTSRREIVEAHPGCSLVFNKSGSSQYKLTSRWINFVPNSFSIHHSLFIPAFGRMQSAVAHERWRHPSDSAFLSPLWQQEQTQGPTRTRRRFVTYCDIRGVQNMEPTQDLHDVRFSLQWLWTIMSSGIWHNGVVESQLTSRRNMMPLLSWSNKSEQGTIIQLCLLRANVLGGCILVYLFFAPEDGCNIEKSVDFQQYMPKHTSGTLRKKTVMAIVSQCTYRL
jgi:hypothetical protein